MSKKSTTSIRKFSLEEGSLIQKYLIPDQYLYNVEKYKYYDYLHSDVKYHYNNQFDTYRKSLDQIFLNMFKFSKDIGLLENLKLFCMGDMKQRAYDKILKEIQRIKEIEILPKSEASELNMS